MIETSRRPDTPIRPLPVNTEAEQALLGAILINNTAYTKVADFLLPQHFGTAVHGRVYTAIAKLISRGQIANPITLKNLFDQDGALLEIGGAQYLAKLAESAVTIINAEHYGRTIHDLALRRHLIALGQDLVENAYSCDFDSPPPAIIAAAVERLREVDRIGAGSTTLGLTIAASLASRPPPERPWLVEGWIPRRQVTLLSGDGGVGKSLIAMQLQLAAAGAGRWLGLDTMPCRSYGLYAEDEDDELHHRLYSIAGLVDANIAELDDMAWHSAAGDAAELVELDDRGVIRPTPYYHQVEHAIITFGARLVVLDAATNLFGGDEVRRRQVNEFIGLLRRLAIKIDGAVILLAHPSVHGISAGTGLSGSTHWNNAVRSRLYIEHAKGEDADPDERTLSRLKANYASIGQVIRVRWVDGGFIPIDTPGGIERDEVKARADRVFLMLLSESYANGAWTCPSLAARNFAPSIFAKHPDRDGLGKPAFQAAMYRLLKAGEIKVETYGSPSSRRSRLAPAAGM